jgi:hypothetical protein
MDTKMEAIRAETKSILAETKAMRDKRMEAYTNDNRKETTVCQDAMESNPEKMGPNPEEMMQSLEGHQEVPKEDATVAKPVNERRKRHRGQKLTAGQCGEPKDLTQRNCGSRRKLAAACRKKVSCHATVAWQKRKLFRKIGTQENFGPRKELTAAGMRKCLEGNDDIRNRDVKEPPNLRKERGMTNGIKGWRARQRSYLGRGGMLRVNLYEILRGMLIKQIVGTPSRLQEMKEWTLWMVRPPPK